MYINTVDTRGVFRNPVIGAIFLSTAFLQIGIWIRNFAILLFIMEKTGDNALAVSLISVAEFAPVLLFSLVGGIYTDRWMPKATMIWCDILSALSIFLILFTVVIGMWKSVYFIMFISASLSQFSLPSRMKLFKLHLKDEDVQSGMAAYQTIFSALAIIGPVIATYVYTNFGINVAIILTGVFFLLSTVALSLINSNTSKNINKIKVNFWLELKEGLQFIKGERTILFVTGIATAIGFAVGIIQPLGVFIVTERLGLPKESFQWLLSVNGIAMLIGGSVVTIWFKKVTPSRLLAIGLLVNAINVFIIAISTNWNVTLTFQFINGLFNPCVHIGLTTIIINESNEKFVGRVNGVLNLISMGAMVMTMSLAGWLKLQFSLVPMYAVASMFFLVGLILIIPLIRGTKKKLQFIFVK